jgi:S1-C subfamily serine protease
VTDAAASAVLDLLLLLVAISYAVTGYRQGLVVGALSLAGFVAGAAAGVLALPELVSGWAPGGRRLAVVVAGVLLLSWLGHLAGLSLGRAVRGWLTWRPARALDSVLGLLCAVVAVGLVTWLVAGAVRTGPFPQLARTVASSTVVGALDRAVPAPVVRLSSRLRSAVGPGSFPRVFDGLTRERILPVEPPDPAAGTTAEVRAALAGIVRVSGLADVCARGQEGTGWVAAPGRVVTNAHVVAGVDTPQVQVGGRGPRLDATVVAFDPLGDVAVLDVPDLPVAPLPTGAELGRGEEAVVAGFPLGGPLTVEPARVRAVVDARGEDIYGNPGAVREVYSLHTVVQPGNSGGPLLNTAGEVVGVVFAKSLDDAETGYALTLDQAGSVIEAGAAARAATPTGGCAQP